MEPMLQRTGELQRYHLQARDGAIGHLEELYFDDTGWQVRYLVVNTGGWLMGRRVLVAPRAVQHVDARDRAIVVDLTREQIHRSPPMDTHQPLSRQYEADYYRYYDWPPYWEGSAFSGIGLPVAPEAPPPVNERETRKVEEPEWHLRSSAEVAGYHVRARDDAVGHVEDLLVDDAAWAIRYIEIDTRNWWPGKKVLLAPAWIEQVCWPQRSLLVDVTRATLESAPAYDPGKIITRDYEVALYRHYGTRQYWQ